VIAASAGLPAAQVPFAEWPSPIADAYRAHDRMPYHRPIWNLTAALYAVWREHGCFPLSPPEGFSRLLC
jgi:hypothetical protein